MSSDNISPFVENEIYYFEGVGRPHGYRVDGFYRVVTEDEFENTNLKITSTNKHLYIGRVFVGLEFDSEHDFADGCLTLLAFDGYFYGPLIVDEIKKRFTGWEIKHP